MSIEVCQCGNKVDTDFKEFDYATNRCEQCKDMRSRGKTSLTKDLEILRDVHLGRLTYHPGLFKDIRFKAEVGPILEELLNLREKVEDLEFEIMNLEEALDSAEGT
jgi:hypothetical protein